MRKLKVADLKPGMVFDQPVYIDATNVLLQSGQELLARDIERLTKWGISEVQTSGQIVRTGGGADAPLPPPVADADPEMARLGADYENFRKARFNIKGMIQQGCDILQAAMLSLTEGKVFDNHALLNLASKLVDEYHARRFFLLAFHGMTIKTAPQVYHSIHAACHALSIGQAAGYTRPKLQDLVFAVLTMDAGMFQIPLHVREKGAPLTDSERAAIKSHPILGNQLLLKIGKVKPALANIALQHQEAFDGTGYPQNLKGVQIDEFARIGQICDSYTAMVEPRPHRQPLLPYEAMKSMLSSDAQRFDPRLLRAFLGKMSIYPIGSVIQLSDKRVGLTLGCKTEKPLRPLVRLLRDETGLPYGSLQFVDLFSQADLYIMRAMEPRSSGIDLEAEI